MKKTLVLGCLFFGIVLAIYGINFFTLQQKMNTILTSSNEGERVNVYYDYYINPKVLVYDLKGISEFDNRTIVFATFLKLAGDLKTRDFDTVKLCFRGKEKFKIKGEYFKRLGEEYEFQNPIYTIDHFPENLLKPDGTNAYSSWTGGELVVVMKQIKDFSDFNDKWYMNDLTKVN